MKALLTLFALFLVLMVTGCGSTRIVSQDPNAEIFLDDQPLGTGEASVSRLGPPKRVILEARRAGETVGQTEMKRSFTGMTVVWGLFSYYTGLYWGWYYPETVIIPLRATASVNSAEAKSPWANPRGSIWMQPLK